MLVRMYSTRNNNAAVVKKALAALNKNLTSFIQNQSLVSSCDELQSIAKKFENAAVKAEKTNDNHHRDLYQRCQKSCHQLITAYDLKMNSYSAIAETVVAFAIEIAIDSPITRGVSNGIDGARRDQKDDYNATIRNMLPELKQLKATIDEALKPERHIKDSIRKQ